MTNTDKIFLTGTIRLEKKYLTSLLEVITDFRSSFIDHLTTNGKDAALHRLLITPLNTDLTPLLLSLYRDAGLFGAKLSDRELNSQLTARDRTQIRANKAASLGQNEAWITDVINFLKLHLVKFVSAITETMRQDIINIISNAVEEGWSLDKMVKELKRLDLMEARANVIARTETIRAANVGHSVAAQSTPYEVNKKWNAAADHNTRPSHLDINGHITSENGLFKVAIYKGDAVAGYDEMLYPGDATATPGNVINCRCRATYLPKRDANNRLIMRQANTAKVIPLRNPSTLIPAHQIAAVLKAHIFIGPKSDTGETE